MAENICIGDWVQPKYSFNAVEEAPYVQVINIIERLNVVKHGDEEIVEYVSEYIGIGRNNRLWQFPSGLVNKVNIPPCLQTLYNPTEFNKFKVKTGQFRSQGRGGVMQTIHWTAKSRPMLKAVLPINGPGYLTPVGIDISDIRITRLNVVEHDKPSVTILAKGQKKRGICAVSSTELSDEEIAKIANTEE
jgi:hypothetical protein